MPEGNEQGWYEDPYELHEERWFSAGVPTKLVRDSGEESYDPVPPEAAPTGPLVRSSSHSEAAVSDDLRRADDPNAGVSPDYSSMGIVQKYKPLPRR